VEKGPAGQDWLDILSLARLAPDSEFLLAFALALAVNALFHRPIRHVLERPAAFAVTMGLLLLGTFLPIKA
jgi:hypothetical protein